LLFAPARESRDLQNTHAQDAEVDAAKIALYLQDDVDINKKENVPPYLSGRVV